MQELSAPPSVLRRIAVMVYEAMLLFGVVFIAGWLFGTLLQQRNALYLRGILQYWLFFVIGAYFIWFWSHGGQTLAMKTWKVRLVAKDGGNVSLQRAAARFALSWLWIVPGLLAAWLLGARGWMLVVIPTVNIVVWAALCLLDPARQFLHDRLAGTRVINVAYPKKK
ncbi:RDD family protein [Actimicrobium antarcticum]|uniref:RDD family protein n=1 Tax=Actimicrobium antarcticum TaxID=1051899 RepID=A0ABP7T1E6_9BURK